MPPYTTEQNQQPRPAAYCKYSIVMLMTGGLLSCSAWTSTVPAHWMCKALQWQSGR